MPPTVADLVERALAAFDALAATAEPVADEWQYVTDLGTVWRARLQAVSTARGARARTGRSRARRSRRSPTRPRRSRTPTGRSTGCRPCPRSRCGDRRAGLMRFLDARPDGRAVVYATSRPTRSSPGRGPARRRDHDPAAARPGGDERRVDRRRRRGGRCSRRCSGRRRRRRATEVATGPRRSSTPRCEVADRGEQARSQFRGAIVEALTERLLAARTRHRSAASGGSCSTGARRRSTRTT